MVIKLQNKEKVIGRRPTYESFRLQLVDGKFTTLHVGRYRRQEIYPKIVLFEEETYLTDWCKNKNILNAIGGGFFLRELSKPLGELWIDGYRRDTVPFASPWHLNRGSMYINSQKNLRLGPRYMFPQLPATDLLQAGPLLLENGEVMTENNTDLEGFSQARYQFDDDLTKGRYPRLAIGTDDNFIFTVACDGRAQDEAGLTLDETASFLKKIGAKEALNLDGGSSATLICNGKLRNRPRGGAATGYSLFKKGRPIYSAICLMPIL